MKLLAHTTCFLLALGLTSAQAQTAPQCRSLDAVSEFLDSRWREYPVWSGDPVQGGEVVIFENTDRGTWSLVTVNPLGCARIVVSGGDAPILPEETAL